MKKIVIVTIPDDKVCYFRNGQPCPLLDQRFDGDELCNGWGGIRFLNPGKKHEKCLREMHLDLARRR